MWECGSTSVGKANTHKRSRQANKSEHTHTQAKQTSASRQANTHKQSKCQQLREKAWGTRGPPPPRQLSFKDGSDPNQYYGRVVRLVGSRNRNGEVLRCREQEQPRGKDA